MVGLAMTSAIVRCRRLRVVSSAHRFRPRPARPPPRAPAAPGRRASPAGRADPEARASPGAPGSREARDGPAAADFRQRQLAENARYQRAADAAYQAHEARQAWAEAVTGLRETWEGHKERYPERSRAELFRN